MLDLEEGAPGGAPEGSGDDLPSSPAPGLQLRCGACGRQVRGSEETRFCAACGAPLHADGQADTVHVLLAEDALVSRRKIVAVLKRLGCRTIEAADGRQAVDLAHSERPALIILDVHMPEMGGIEALGILRADDTFAATPIVMLTGEANASVVRQALTQGAADYIRKDSSPKKLQERLNRHIHKLRARD